MERSEALTTSSAPLREGTGSYIDWPAILAGTVVAAALGGLFTTFGAALGLGAVSAEPGEGSFNLMMVITAFWVIVTLIVSFAAGGYIAGRMRRRIDNANADEVQTRDGINGLVVWGLATLLTGWMAASALGTATTAVGSAVGGVAQAAGTAVGGMAQAAGSTVGGVVSAAGSAVGGVAQGIGQTATAAIEDDGISSYLNDTLLRPALDGAANGPSTTPRQPAMDDAELARQTGAIIANVFKTGEVSDDERAFLVAATASRTDLSEAEVEARVDQAVTAAQDARAQAEEAIATAQAQAEEALAAAEAEAARLAEEAQQAAIDAAETARKAAIMTAFLLTAAALVAAAAAIAAAVRGGLHRDEGRIFGGLSYRITR